MPSMRARDYASINPLHAAPSGPYVDPGHREEALSDALRGVELGAYDEQIKAWMVRFLDDSTLRTIVSLIERVRAQGMLDALAVEAALQARRRERRDPGRSR